MNMIVTIIPTDLVKNSLLSSFVLFYTSKTRIRFSASWWSGNKKYFCFFFITSCTLLQSHVKFNKLLQRNFLRVIPVRIIFPSIYLYAAYADEITALND